MTKVGHPLFFPVAALPRPSNGMPGPSIAARASEAIQILQAQRFDLVVLCHTVDFCRHA
jgi:hypothetical protein